MKAHTILKILPSLCISLLLTACDPGYDMHPIGMEKIGTQEQWNSKFDGFELRVNKIGGLIGEWWMSLYVMITTESKPVTIESVELQTPRGIYPAEINNGLKIIPAFSNSEKIYISWHFKDQTPAVEIMGDSSRIIFHMKVGNEKKTVEIEYKRAD